MFCFFFSRRFELEKYLTRWRLGNPKIRGDECGRALTGQPSCCYMRCEIKCQVSFLSLRADYFTLFLELQRPRLCQKKKKKAWSLWSLWSLDGFLCVSLIPRTVPPGEHAHMVSSSSSSFVVLCSAVAFFTKL